MPPALATLLVLGAGYALAQGAAGPVLKPLTQYHLESWQTRDGLPTNGIRALAQDADGFLWLGTEAGLVRFDGVEFRTFDRNSTPGAEGERRHRPVRRQRQPAVDRHRRRRRAAAAATASSRSSARSGCPARSAPSTRISAASSGSPAAIRSAGSSENTLVLMRGRVDTVASIYEDATGVLTLGTYGPLGRIEDDTIRLEHGRPRGRPGGAPTVRRHVVAGPAHGPAAHRRRAAGPALHDRRRPAVAERHGAARSIAAAACGSGRPPAWRAWSAIASSRAPRSATRTSRGCS